MQLHAGQAIMRRGARSAGSAACPLHRHLRQRVFEVAENRTAATRPLHLSGQLLAYCASQRCIRRTPVGRGEANKVGVRYTFNCVLWFNHFERQLAAEAV